MKKFKIKSFCKINLTLKILKRLKNNYHIISSLITFCNINDVIFISKIKDKKDIIKFSGKFKKGINKLGYYWHVLLSYWGVGVLDDALMMYITDKFLGRDSLPPALLVTLLFAWVWVEPLAM